MGRAAKELSSVAKRFIYAMSVGVLLGCSDGYQPARTPRTRLDAAAAPDANGGSERPFVEDKLLSTECAAMPAMTASSWLLVDCAGNQLGKLNLSTGAVTPLAPHDGVITSVSVTDDYVLFVDSRGLQVVSLHDGTVKQLAEDATATVFGVTSDSKHVVLQRFAQPNELVSVAADGNAEAISLTDSNTTNHRFIKDANRLFYTSSSRLLSVDVASSETVDLASAEAAIISRDGSRVAWVDKPASKLVVRAADGGELREWLPDVTPLAAVAFTPDGSGLVVQGVDSLQLLSFEDDTWSSLATPPKGVMMQVDINAQALFFQYALGELDMRGNFPAGFGFAAAPLNGDPLAMLAELNFRYFSDYIWQRPIVFSADLAEAIVPTRGGGLAITDLESLTTREWVGRACGVGAAGFSPDRNTLVFWMCDDVRSPSAMVAADHAGKVLTRLDWTAKPPAVFAADSRHFLARSENSFWLATLEGKAEHYAMDLPAHEVVEPFFPVWLDAGHVVYNHGGTHLLTLRD